MTEWVWSAVEVRIVCLVESFNTDENTRVPNIFYEIDYRLFNQYGNIFEEYEMQSAPTVSQSCSYPVTSYLQTEDRN